MQTKFALALALSHDADLLILDEPTSGLDPVFRRELLRRLSALMQDERKSVLFSTHITADLERIADYITFIRDGKIVFSASKDELLENWGVVKGDDSVVAAVDPAVRKGVRHGPYGVQVLTSNVNDARKRLGAGAIIDKASLEDIMVLMSGDKRHAA